MSDYAIAYMQRPKDNLGCCSLTSTLFETGSLVHSCLCEANWPSGFKESCLSPISLQNCCIGNAQACIWLQRVLGLCTLVHVLAPQSLYVVSHLPSPINRFLNWIFKDK